MIRSVYEVLAEIVKREVVKIQEFKKERNILRCGDLI